MAAPSPEEEKILVLESQVQKLRKQKKNPTKDRKRKAKMARKGKKSFLAVDRDSKQCHWWE